jgi:hypothetical protein
MITKYLESEADFKTIQETIRTKNPNSFICFDYDDIVFPAYIVYGWDEFEDFEFVLFDKRAFD